MATNESCKIMSLNREINEYMLKGRVDVREEVILIYISMKGDEENTRIKVERMAGDYDYPEDTDIHNVYLEYISALKDLFE